MFRSVDPLAKVHESHYAAFANNPIWFIDPDGGDTVVFFDQANNPDNRRVYTGTINVVKAGQILGPYTGSTYPNNDNTQNTLNVGWHDYNNVSGHHGGTQMGLNIVDAKGNRNAPGTNPQGNAVTMQYVNVHLGVPPVQNNGLDNRGSAGCPTICPTDAASFFENFDWKNRAQTTGTSEGRIGIYRGDSQEATNFRNILEVKQILQNSGTTGTPVELNRGESSNSAWIW